MTRSISGYRPAPRYNGTSWLSARLDWSTDGVAATEVETFALPPEADPSKPSVYGFTSEIVPDNASYLRIVWIDETGPGDYTDWVSLADPSGYCTVQQVRARVGRDLSDDEVAQIEGMIVAAGAYVLAALGKDASFTIPLTARSYVSALCVELVTRAFANPLALGQQSETIGQYSYTRTFARELPSSGLGLTDLEARILRSVVFGATSGSAQVEGFPDTWAPIWIQQTAAPIQTI